MNKTLNRQFVEKVYSRHISTSGNMRKSTLKTTTGINKKASTISMFFAHSRNNH